MAGGHSGASLKTDMKTGEVTLTITERETHADREVSTVYKRSSEDFEAVREIVNKYNLYNASKKGRSPIQVLDGDTHSVSFDYSKDYFSVSDYQALSRKEIKGLWEVRDYLYSLAPGEGVTTLEPQTAMLYLHTGYTFSFYIDEAFDGKLDEILSEEFEVYGYNEEGTVINKTEDLNTEGVQAVSAASGGEIIYDKETGEIVILYKDCEFGREVYLLATPEHWYQETSEPHIREMEGLYRLYLN